MDLSGPRRTSSGLKNCACLCLILFSCLNTKTRVRVAERDTKRNFSPLVFILNPPNIFITCAINVPTMSSFRNRRHYLCFFSLKKKMVPMFITHQHKFENILCVSSVGTVSIGSSDEPT